MRSHDPALGPDGLPLDELVAKFADIAGSVAIAAPLVAAAARLSFEITGCPPSVLDVERMLFAAFDEPMPAIRTHPKARLVRRMLDDDQALDDGETEDAINFLVSHVAIKMQGEVAEILGLAALAVRMEQWRLQDALPPSALLIPGRSLRMRVAGREAWYKGADGLIVSEDGPDGGLLVHAVVEIKSRRPSWRSLRRQMDRHRQRLVLGLCIDATVIAGQRITCAEQFRAVLAAPADQFTTRTPTDIVTVPIAVPTRHLTEAGLGLVRWMVERMGEDLFTDPAQRPDGMDAPEAAVNTLRRALYYADMRPLGRPALSAAAALMERC